MQKSTLHLPEIKKELDGKRGYRADFEIYDQRAIDTQNTVLDILIGME